MSVKVWRLAFSVYRLSFLVFLRFHKHPQHRINPRLIPLPPAPEIIEYVLVDSDGDRLFGWAVRQDRALVPVVRYAMPAVIFESIALDLLLGHVLEPFPVGLVETFVEHLLNLLGRILNDRTFPFHSCVLSWLRWSSHSKSIGRRLYIHPDAHRVLA